MAPGCRDASGEALLLLRYPTLELLLQLCREGAIARRVLANVVECQEATRCRTCTGQLTRVSDDEHGCVGVGAEPVAGVPQDLLSDAHRLDRRLAAELDPRVEDGKCEPGGVREVSGLPDTRLHPEDSGGPDDCRDGPEQQVLDSVVADRRLTLQHHLVEIALDGEAVLTALEAKMPQLALQAIADVLDQAARESRLADAKQQLRLVRPERPCRAV